MEPELHLETLCATAREDVPSESRPLVAPIYQSAVWALDSPEQCEAIYQGETPGYIYTRDANPNHTALEGVIASLERAEAAVVFGSGMAALAAPLTALSRAGGRVVAARQLYGATARLLDGELSRFGVTTEWVDMTRLSHVEAALQGGADLLLVETLANPLVEVADLPRLARICRQTGTLLAVDNTFASPACCRPLERGADLVLHSVTSFWGGHSDVTLGAAAGRAELMEKLRRQARLFGGAANPFECWLALRGVTTFPLRMERSCANALELAQRLEAHPRVRRTFYPGLPSHSQHRLAEALLDSYGAMLAFELETADDARELLRRLRHVRFAPSLGDVATTISYPVATSHRGFAPEELAALGITPAVLRLSVGIDHVDDVWADLLEGIGSRG
ncbi:MAG: trans-sulfuration enzyme family protein [Armatimonadota bacterium]